MRPQFGNTLAVSITNYTDASDLRSQLRLKFELWNETYSKDIAAVWCDELYAEQIEKEEQDDDI